MDDNRIAVYIKQDNGLPHITDITIYGQSLPFMSAELEQLPDSIMTLTMKLKLVHSRIVIEEQEE